MRSSSCFNLVCKATVAYCGALMTEHYWGQSERYIVLQKTFAMKYIRVLTNHITLTIGYTLLIEYLGWTIPKSKQDR